MTRSSWSRRSPPRSANELGSEAGPLNRLEARPGQGEALAVWAMWGAVTLAVLVTYSRIDTDELYNVSRGGLAGGLGRSVVLLNFPIAFVAVATTLVAMAVLPKRAWLAAAPAIALLRARARSSSIRTTSTSVQRMRSLRSERSSRSR